MAWIIFSIGVHTHFYIYSRDGVTTTNRIHLQSLEQIEEVVAATNCADITFVTRYETEEEFRHQRHPDAIVDRLRETYRRPAAPAAS